MLKPATKQQNTFFPATVSALPQALAGHAERAPPPVANQPVAGQQLAQLGCRQQHVVELGISHHRLHAQAKICYNET